MRRKIMVVKISNWFKLLRLGKKGELKSSTFRQLERDVYVISSQLQLSVGQPLFGKQFDAQRLRAGLMIDVLTQADEMLMDLNKEQSKHNCFALRLKIESLKAFLVKYSALLETYNNKFLEKIHEAIEVNIANGRVFDDNLIYTEGGEIEIIK